MGRPGPSCIVVDLAGNSRPYVTGRVNVSGVQWIPDGTGISFLAKRNDDKETCLYVIPRSTEGKLGDCSASRPRLAITPGIPDGKRIAFLATDPPDEAKKKLADQGFNAEFYEEELKPVKVWLAAADFESSEEPQALDLPGTASELHFSPDGDRLARRAHRPATDRLPLHVSPSAYCGRPDRPRDAED
jgi:Tol biopolymer transport system component